MVCLCARSVLFLRECNFFGITGCIGPSNVCAVLEVDKLLPYHSSSRVERGFGGDAASCASTFEKDNHAP